MEAVRAIAIVVVWMTLSGGLLLGTLWFRHGGGRSIGPEDEILTEQGAPPQASTGRTTSFAVAQVVIHAMFGLLTAILITYAAAHDGDRRNGYVASIVAIVVTASLGTLMFLKWRRGSRPRIGESRTPARGPRVEDRLPSPVVYAHGLAAAATATLVIVLLAGD